MSTAEQRAAALATANDRRLRRAALKRGCRAGTISPLTLITDELFARTFVTDVLALAPRVGPSTATSMLAALQLPVTLQCGNVTERQHALLARWLRSGPRGRAKLKADELARWVPDSDEWDQAA